MEDSTQGWTQLEPFFPKSGQFFWFSKKGSGGVALLPPLQLHAWFVNEKEIFNFKAGNENLTFQLNFVLEAYLMDLVLLSQEKYL